MTEPTSPGTPRPDPAQGRAAAKPAAAGAAGVPSPGEPVPVDQLSPEEQMALFEKELKEKDWGHQPC